MKMVFIRLFALATLFALAISNCPATRIRANSTPPSEAPPPTTPAPRPHSAPPPPTNPDIGAGDASTASTPQTAPFALLPDEILLNIAKFLDLENIHVLRGTCRNLRRVLGGSVVVDITQEPFSRLASFPREIKNSPHTHIHLDRHESISHKLLRLIFYTAGTFNAPNALLTQADLKVLTAPTPSSLSVLRLGRLQDPNILAGLCLPFLSTLELCAPPRQTALQPNLFLSKETLKALVSKGNLRELKLRKWAVAGETLMALAGISTLSHLSLDTIQGVTQEALHTLFSCLPLTSLECSDLTPAPNPTLDITALFGALAQRTTLRSFCWKGPVTQQNLEALAQSTTLRELILPGCVDEEASAGLLALARTPLESLDLIGCSSLPPEPLIEFANQTETLAKIRVMGCRHVMRDPRVIRAFASCPSLTHVDMGRIKRAIIINALTEENLLSTTTMEKFKGLSG